MPQPIPREYAKIHAAGLQSMVDVEDEGVRHARAVVSAVTAQYGGQRQDESHARRNATIAAVLLYRGMSGAVTLAQHGAVLAADGLLSQELRHISESLRKAPKPVAATLSEAEVFKHSVEASRAALGRMGSASAYRGSVADVAATKRATEAAKGYVKAWREKLDGYLESRASRGSNPAHAFQDAASAVDHKVVTNVATEVSVTFNNRHASEVQRLVQQADHHSLKSMFLRWDAVLDKGTCDTCSGMHGKIVPAKNGFSTTPGSVHPRCRCQEQLIWLPT